MSAPNIFPKVSICLPNLNTRLYLPERFETIFNQTFQDWELIVCDNYSDDGAWEFIQEQAGRDKRVRISQAPREGLYANWNNCIRLARGDYVYIATSDDTMMPDCLEKMVAELEVNSDCGLCQCELVIIDEKSLPKPSERQWRQYTLGAYDQNLVQKKNKRLAPHDGMLHPALFTIYTSITQLLIRRTVFDKIGYFEKQWGSISDFEWDMRAGLMVNCIYIPEKLATWRLHPTQATQDVHTVPNRVKMIEMTRAAFARAKAGTEKLLQTVDINDLVYFLERDIVEMEYMACHTYLQKIIVLFKRLFSYPLPVFDFVTDRLRRRKWGPWWCANRYGRLRKILRKYSVPAPLFDKIES